ncbi:DUF6894 family protein [Lichenibacterium ramalinae]|uniref:DUF6894 domain-containing protein n=1 Tax=Lichenibacterium ramalinae TaxID=2316527 RepID=A0A4Q2R729_9HYPH|nr:hypothetical protein [Lichenibacterium ramalinae]RYB01489.1 hypothetical protein D3272_25915 [Lichenibacterium ramalinae]
MPTYFFDVYDGEVTLRDEFGIDLETGDEAAAQAAALLPDIARDTLPGTTSRDFIVSVRDEAGLLVHRAALLFRARWMPDTGAPEGEPRGAPATTQRHAARSGGHRAGGAEHGFGRRPRRRRVSAAL